MMRMIRRTLAISGVMIALAAGLVAGAVWLTLPAQDHTARAGLLRKEALIQFDAHGIPWIKAGSDEDAAFTLGYVHARDRAFQMDLMRRAASGRLSELAGTATLPLDRLMRTLGLRHRAEADLQTLPPATKALLVAYANGVNARFQEKGRFSSPEFLLSSAPEPWSPVDSLLWGKSMMLYLSGNYRTELARAELAATIPRDRIMELWPAGSTEKPVDAALLSPRFAEAARHLLAMLPQEGARFTLPSTASNEWAVDGAHSATGAPLLAGDPHLSFGLPGLWYLARIETPDHVLVGATAPGTPFLIIGHNGRIAWTFTTSVADTQDLFIETELDPGHYASPDGKLAYETRQEIIHVRGATDVTLTVRETRHGPVISDLAGRSGPVMALSATGLMRGDTASAGLAMLNKAQSVQEASLAAPLISSPVQNLLIADHDTIGVFTTGRLPLRKEGDGSWPVPGADGSHDWTGTISGDALPHSLAPSSGRLVNANERLRTSDPVGNQAFLGRDGLGEWRANRIRQMLDGAGKASLDDFVTMQTDRRSLFAQTLLPRLRLIRAEGDTETALSLLAGWDGTMSESSPAPLIFNAWMDRFRSAVLAKANVPVPDAAVPPLEFSAWLLSDAGAHWCDGSDCTQQLTRTLEETVHQLKALYGPRAAEWQWGQAHQVTFRHPLLSRIPVLKLVGQASASVSGDDSTVGRAGTSHAIGADHTLADGDFEDLHGASYRGVYDLADLTRSRFIAAPGQSGNVFSPHARDFIPLWRDGQTLPLGQEPSHIEAILHLIPANAP
ncbi:Penicillin acylase [Granulibacter bethesdensis CGDNIH1]|uniref:Penicillin acylase n=2 Tax=Granulibacter bethesdensis TaxID=364410 RepID=Q0BTF7_GRABC|nr:Penicillin acylase [Granulibacter bethesdensis CGDNIH1]APH51709.1 Penicillin acylase [Granulibacter bethesdensis]APH64402.1 Penicillin acylase [Granulibacter bethesdensis]